jgi:hypothetical protein
MRARAARDRSANEPVSGAGSGSVAARAGVLQGRARLPVQLFNRNSHGISCDLRVSPLLCLPHRARAISPERLSAKPHHRGIGAAAPLPLSIRERGSQELVLPRRTPPSPRAGRGGGWWRAAAAAAQPLRFPCSLVASRRRRAITAHEGMWDARCTHLVQTGSETRAGITNMGTAIAAPAQQWPAAVHDHSTRPPELRADDGRTRT